MSAVVATNNSNTSVDNNRNKIDIIRDKDHYFGIYDRSVRKALSYFAPNHGITDLIIAGTSQSPNFKVRADFIKRESGLSKSQYYKCQHMAKATGHCTEIRTFDPSTGNGFGIELKYHEHANSTDLLIKSGVTDKFKGYQSRQKTIVSFAFTDSYNYIMEPHLLKRFPLLPNIDVPQYDTNGVHTGTISVHPVLGIDTSEPCGIDASKMSHDEIIALIYKLDVHGVLKSGELPTDEKTVAKEKAKPATKKTATRKAAPAKQSPVQPVQPVEQKVIQAVDVVKMVEVEPEKSLLIDDIRVDESLILANQPEVTDVSEEDVRVSDINFAAKLLKTIKFSAEKKAHKLKDTRLSVDRIKPSEFTQFMTSTSKLIDYLYENAEENVDLSSKMDDVIRICVENITSFGRHRFGSLEFVTMNYLIGTNTTMTFDKLFYVDCYKMTNLLNPSDAGAEYGETTAEIERECNAIDEMAAEHIQVIEPVEYLSFEDAHDNDFDD